MKHHHHRVNTQGSRQPGIRNLFRQANVEIEPQRGGDFILEELPQAAVLRVDPAQ